MLFSRLSFRRRLGLLAAALCLLGATPVSAQEIRGTFLGRVTDPSTSSVPGAKVIITNQDTNASVEVTTNLEGNYAAPFLQPGRYTLAVEKEGFSKATRSNVTLQTQDRMTLDFMLKPGSVNESVTVSAESPMLQTASADFGQVIDSNFLNRLPVVGISPLGMADMAPGVVPARPDANVSDYNTTYIQINGSNGQGNQITVDGAPAEVPRVRGASYVVPMADMVGEMKVVTAMFDAAQGRSNGGSILISTKSGGNTYHGSAYYHIRDERFNANSWTNNYRGVARGLQNFWVAGGSLSGPIRKDRTFFSFGLEKEHNIFTMNSNFRVPTAAEREGDFSQTLAPGGQALQLYDPLTTVLDSSGRFVSRQLFSSARIPASRLNPIGVATANQYPVPNYLELPNQLGQVNLLTTRTDSSPNQNLQTRVDQMLFQKHRLYFRWARNHGTIDKYDHPPVPGYAASNGANTDDRMANHYVVDDTVTLTPSLVASFRGGFNRFNQSTSGWGDTMDPDLLKLSPVLKGILYSGGSAGTGWPRMDINDGSVPSIGPQRRRSVNDILTFTNTYNKLMGSHNLRWGVDYRNTRWFEDRPGDAQNGSFTFDKNLTRANDNSASNTTSGSGVATLLLGLPTGGSVSRSPAMAVQSHYAGLYVQDDYRITRRLTLCLGLRYDLETPLTDRYDRLSFDFNPDGDLGITVPGIGPIKGGLRFVNANGTPRRQGYTDTNNIGPRVSATYALNDKTVVRAGWGLFYEGLTSNLSGGAPASVASFNFVTSYIGSSDSNRTVIPGVNLSSPFPNGFQPVTGSANGYLSLIGDAVSFVTPHRALPGIQQMQVGVQRQLPWQSLVEVAYVGTRYNGLLADYNLNDVPDAYRTQDNSTSNPFYGILPVTSFARSRLHHHRQPVEDALPAVLFGGATIVERPLGPLSRPANPMGEAIQPGLPVHRQLHVLQEHVLRPPECRKRSLL